MIVIGALLVLAGLGLGAGAAVLGLLAGAQRDGGYLSVPEETYSVGTYAITSAPAEIGSGAGGDADIAEVLVRATNPGGDLFIGIGPEADVDRYLAGVATSQIEEVRFDPFSVEYEETPGTGVPGPPAQQTFWAAASEGSGTREITWAPSSGDWTVVVMNADGSPQVTADLQAGVRSGLFGTAAWWLLLGAVVLFLGGIALILAGILTGRNRRPGYPGFGDDPGSGGYPGAGAYGYGPVPATGHAMTAGQPASASGPFSGPASNPEPAGFGGTGAGAGGPSGPEDTSLSDAGAMPAAAHSPAGSHAPAAAHPAGARAAEVPPGRNGPGSGDPYPARLYGELDGPLSRRLWLVKWFLAIPHFFLLAFLWIAFWVATVIAFFAILFTARYPRALYDFNVGVIRWSWRVAFYATGVLGTDRYPPFSLERENYPADFSVDYPERLSRGLVLVKWWLLVIPQALVVSAFSGTALVLARTPGMFGPRGYGYGDDGPVWGRGQGSGFGYQWWTAGFSLLGLLVFIAAVALLFTRRYPRQLFDFIMGLQRWSYRVLAYTSLMRDEYPPFRLDQGPADARDLPASGLPPSGPAPSDLPVSEPPVSGPPESGQPESGQPSSGSSAG